MAPDLAATLINDYTQPGDLVFDPLAGIGTTLIEAVHAGRNAFGIEYEPGWVAWPGPTSPSPAAKAAPATRASPAATPPGSPAACPPSCAARSVWC